MISTPHIVVNEESTSWFAKTVLMPGDPKRAEYIAKNHLTDVNVISDVRAIKAFTGYYDGTRVSVMASGMGMPSIGIYSNELFNIFNVDNIIRIGSAGAIDKSLKVGDIVIGQGACTNSNFLSQYNLPGTFAPIANFELLKTAYDTAVLQIESTKYNCKVGNLLSSDTFYDDSNKTMDWGKMGVLAVEMETASLYATAARAGKRALGICTISDLLFSSEAMTAEERETTLNTMIEIALKTAKII
ncbi:MAG: purine-nucleoside phosphorylase [Oscillospiraceae bacterium]|nr:purine-nucleoside phosphorylase [Oscillospiraceae bacterium]